MWINPESGDILRTAADLRARRPDVSFPVSITADLVLAFGYAPITPSAPGHDPATQDATEAAPAIVGGAWVQQWAITDLPPEVIAAKAEAARRAAIPASVSPRQIRQALTATGMRSQVESAVAAADQDTKDWWEFATEFERNHPMVAAMGAALGVSDASLDDLWTLAGAL